MDDAVGRRAKPCREFGRCVRPVQRRAHCRLAPEVQPRRRAGRYKIGAVRADARRHVGECAVDPGADILRGCVDEAHRDAGNHMLERRTALQRIGPRPQPQAQTDQYSDQQQRYPVEQPAKLSRRGARRALADQDQLAQRLLVRLSRHRAHRLQGVVDGGQKVMKNSPVRQ
jgi:hypothetical protein